MKNSNISFNLCGLDHKCNFLEAPICKCGCGKRANLVLKNDNDVFSFMHTMLEEHECDWCGIFAFKNNNRDMLMGLKLDGEIKCYHTQINGDIKNCLKDLQDDFELHCYGLLEQVNDELYSIVID